MIAITGATGHLGRLTVQALLDRGVAADQIVALVRDPQKAADFAARGIQVRAADYHQPDTLKAALAGVDRLLLISSNDFQDRVGQHRNVIRAAREAGVRQLAYTSILNADTTDLMLAADHQATETELRQAGVPYTLLRNGWYIENYTGNLAQTFEHGAMIGSAGEGRFNPAARQDYAEAAAAVLTSEGHEHQTYELGGDEAVTMPQLAEELSRLGGRTVRYQSIPEAEYAEMLAGFGVPAPVATILADSDAGVQRGALATDRHDLSRLIGRPTTTLTAALSAALQG